MTTRTAVAPLVAGVVLAALLLVALLVAVTVGPAPIGVADVWRSIAAHLGFAESTLPATSDAILSNSRF